MFLNLGVDITSTDRNGCNALHLACSIGQVDIVLMILNASRKQNLICKQRKKALENKYMGPNNTQSQPLPNHFDIDVVDKNFMNALMKAVFN